MKYLITLMTVVVAMMFPSVSHAQNSIRDDLQNAESSSLFQKKISSSQISAHGLDRVQLHNGAQLEFKKYTELTRLDQSERFKPLMSAAVVNEYLRAKPTYTEDVLQLQDRLIVARTMKVPLKEGVCRQRNLPIAVNELCFTDGNGPLPDETRNYLMDLRVKLSAAEPGAEVKSGVTAAQLARMDDKELLEALLNSDDREIRLVSVLPTEIYQSRTEADLWNTTRRLASSDFNGTKPPSVIASSQFSTGPGSASGSSDGNKVFPKEYFLTGFTLGREISDTFEVQIAPSTLLTDRYYVRFEYSFSAGLGLRFPFSVSVESHAIDGLRPTLVTQGRMAKVAPQRKSESVSAVRGKPGPGSRTVQSSGSDKGRVRDHRTTAVNPAQVVAGENTPTVGGNPVTRADISISVAPVNVERNGSPAYPAVNLPQGKYFDGKEFVLEVGAGCKFKASIPGKDIDLACPDEIGFNESRDIDPVIGSDRAKLGELWVEGAPLGLGIEAWAGTASLDFGIQANLTNGQVGVIASGFNRTLIDNQSAHSFSFKNTDAQQFKIVNPQNTGAAFSLNTPSYSFDLELLPVARAKVELDLGYKKWKKTLGPYSVDALSLTVGGFTMEQHEGTVGSHIYSF